AHTGENNVASTIKFDIAVMKKDLVGGGIGITVFGQGIKGEKGSEVEHATRITFESTAWTKNGEDHITSDPFEEWNK
ncbi:MAG TPA: hypothetical protein PLS49_07085, partial [Candidatus Woesebacteria bacterium]|nr:hypothetical protein [Candidatus Woesebacteria bacterium]